MSKRAQDDVLELDPTEFTRRDLLAAAAGENPELHPVMAVSLLGRKRYARKTKSDDLVRLLDDEATPDRARTAAAIELGRLGTDSAEAALVERCARSSRVRDQATRGLRELMRLHGASQQVQKAARAEGPARITNAAAQAATAPVLYVDEERAEEITTRRASAKQRDQVADQLREDVENLGLDPASGREMRCVGQRLVFMTPAELVERLADATVGSPSVAAAVATQDTQETGRWSARYYVVVTPTDAGLELGVVTRSGKLAFAGRGELHDGTVAFSVRAVASPGSAPALVEGTFGPDGVRFSKALSESRVVARRVARPRR